MAAMDIFQPISSGSGEIPGNISQRGDHPVPRTGIVSILHSGIPPILTHLNVRAKAVPYRRTNSMPICSSEGKRKGLGPTRIVCPGQKEVVIFRAGV